MDEERASDGCIYRSAASGHVVSRYFQRPWVAWTTVRWFMRLKPAPISPRRPAVPKANLSHILLRSSSTAP
eukprot:5097798-Pyramimonas_sp.AAC.1